DSISVVVVSYNSEKVLGDCLRSLDGRGVDVVVVDNASADGSVDAARSVRVIANPSNRGFATAANQGAAAASGDVILFLNPDTVLLEGLDTLARTLRSDAQAGAAAGVLVDSQTKLPQRGFSVRRLPDFLTLAFEVLGLNRIWPSNPINRRYRCADLDLSQRQ